MWQDLIVKQALSFTVPLVAGYLKPYLSAAADRLIVAELRTLVAKLPVAAQKYPVWAVDDLQAAWGV